MRTRIINRKRFARSEVDTRVGIKIVMMAIDERVDFILNGTSELAVEHVEDLVAVVIMNSGRQSRCKFHHAQRDRLRSGRAANLIPNAQCSVNQRIALAHFGNAAATFESYCHVVSLYPELSGGASFGVRRLVGAFQKAVTSRRTP